MDHFISSLISKFTQVILKQDHSDNLAEEIKYFISAVIQCILHYYGGAVAKLIIDQPGEVYDLVLDLVFTEPISKLLIST